MVGSGENARIAARVLEDFWEKKYKSEVTFLFLVNIKFRPLSRSHEY